ncbi:MAG TPA: hypothetical protein DEB30_02505 [Candidatus Peribacter riflensis]|uniref:Uncharacterized protein n=1 Tax=Candidatus Peribacter riflensis TaxID=1735162 RepID=A0A0S1SQJ2_9BACT|nr:MAG: hypothetical protein PeribacterA2_0515 [Candidatus Peribacter riflensis]OGJ77052.1 MAG: hypothetical protein A2398_02900 [Candidatus Peribacteria bacterium RIFOXYB1_FULL_57_12]ALM10997.1 MAG: hypothetical protein PeribacterB2_0514 [Candidatus Peribacter riflensis]ALM12100.1 MAG: hypothetical protein PeribacterC2_0514 [Candidatus Peribacter riflensis]ALM13203.1 MAG: hypothetical protein PeribacterD1_0515 [Candidatus Peribacter riflensis]
MKKLLLISATLLPLLFLASKAHAQDYSYDCLCLFSDPNGTCREYTCDAYERRSYYNNDYDRNDYRPCGSSRYCASSTTYRPRYWNTSTSSQYYYNNDSRYDYDWYYRRYSSRTSYYNNQPYYNNNPYYYY